MSNYENEKRSINIEEFVDFFDDETIAEFAMSASGLARRYCIVADISDDLSLGLEETLHRILSADGTDEDVFRILGATKDSPEGISENSISIDLGYSIPGEITHFRVLDKDSYRRYCLHWYADHGIFMEDIAEEVDLDETTGLYFRIRNFAQIKLGDNPMTFLEFSSFHR